jgi:hypothetical protein
MKANQMARYTVTAKSTRQGNKIIHRYETNNYDSAMDMLDTYLDNYGHLKVEMIDTQVYGRNAKAGW